jgi:hypothetical protein
MVYSIAILEQSDFESIGRQMPSGTGIDASLADGSTSTRKRKKRGKNHRNSNNNVNNNNAGSIASVIASIGNSESRLQALRILIEYGTPAEKRDALAEVRAMAQLTTATASMASGAGTNAAENSAATSEDVTAEANDEASCTGSEDEDSDGSL